MALLLRMGGVPARVATGFSPGGFSKRRDAWIVRDTDAHAWVEAWFDELGWVTYDPTPDSTPARSQIAALEAPPAAAAPPAESGDPPPAAAAPAARRLGGVRPDLLFDPQRNNTGGALAGARTAGMPWWLWAGRRGRRPGARRRLAGRRVPPPPRPRPDVAARPRGLPSSRPRCAAPAGRSRPARRCASSSSASAAPPRPPPTCAR